MSAPTGQPAPQEPKPKTGIDAILDAEFEGLPTDEPPAEPAGEVPLEVPVVAPVGEPPAAAPPIETPPAAATPAATPPTTPAAAAPATPPTEPEPQKDGSPWKAAREAQRTAREATEELNRERARLAQLQARENELLVELEQRRAAPVAAPDLGLPTDDDPITTIQTDIAQLKARNAELEVAVQRQTRDATLRTQADAYAVEHPDYPAAQQYYIEKEIEAAELTGEIDQTATTIRQRAGNLVREVAVKQGITEAQASRELAKGLLYEQRLDLMTRAAAANGETVPDRVYRLAKLRGFAGGNGAPPEPSPTAVVPAQPVASPTTSAAEQIRQEAARATGASLATMPHVGTPAPQTLTHGALVAMPGPQMDRLIEYMDQAAHYGLVAHEWMEQVSSGATLQIPTAEEMRIARGG